MSRTRALAGVGLVLFVLLLAVPAVAPHALSSWMRTEPAASTVEHPDAISWSVTVGDEASGLWESFPVTLTWSDSAAGLHDGFSLELPDELAPLTDAFDVRTAAGETVARAVVDDRSLTLTYAEDVRELVTGTATFMAGWNDAEVSHGEQVTLQFATSGASVDVPVSIDAGDGDPAQARLYGYWRDRAHEDRVAAEGAVQWRFVTPVGPLAATVLDVQAAEGHHLDCAEISGRLQTKFAANGDAIDAHDLPAGTLDVQTCDAHSFTVELPAAETGTAVMVQYSSTVTDPTAQSYATSATARIGGAEHEFTSTVERTVTAGSGHGSMTHELTAAPLGQRSSPSGGTPIGWVPVAAAATLGLVALLYRITRTAR